MLMQVIVVTTRNWAFHIHIC